MTDFLSRLIERSTGRAAVAHPVVAPLFATGPSLAAEAADDGEGDTASVPPTSDAASRSSEAFLSRSQVDAPPASAAPATRTAPVPASFESTRFPPGVARPLPDDHRERIRDDRLAAEPRSRERVLASQARIEGRAASRDAEGHDRGGIETREVRQRLLPSPELPRRALAGAAAHPLTLEQPPAPIIRVSIGRIDVRAVAPGAPPAPVPAPTRKDDRQSLEEYLKPSGRRR